MSDVMQGDDVLGFYTLYLASTWAMFDTADSGHGRVDQHGYPGQCRARHRGYSRDNVLGLGPGVYRLQPFLAQAGEPTQGGLSCNAQQQLGEKTPLGWFGRFGVGGSEVTAGASAQIGTGLVLQGPLAHDGLLSSRAHDIALLGFVWSQPSASATPGAQENEYVLEAGYLLQLTPTSRLQPDLQYVWNPAYNPESSRSLFFQLQLDLLW